MITFNRALTEMLGYSEEEIRNMDWFEGVSFLVEKDDRKKTEGLSGKTEKNPGIGRLWTTSEKEKRRYYLSERQQYTDK